MKSHARLRLRQPVKPETTMLRVGGKPFRCNCGANVFTKKSVSGKTVFVCNGCQEWYA